MDQSWLKSLGNTPLETPAAPPCPSPQVRRLRSLLSCPLSLCDIRILLFYSLESSKRCDTTVVQRARVLQSPSYKLPLLCFYLLFNRIFHQSKYHFSFRRYVISIAHERRLFCGLPLRVKYTMIPKWLFLLLSLYFAVEMVAGSSLGKSLYQCFKIKLL